jgi:1-deoxyxylulose-5-phosphate synthase
MNEAESHAALHHAYFDLGINTFDTANAYSAGESERAIGSFVKKYNIPREEIVILTKCFFPDSGFTGGKPKPNTYRLSRKAILASVDGSLQRLGTDYIDVLQIHRFDSLTPIEETMEALHDVIKSGKVRYIGASSMAAWQFAKVSVLFLRCFASLWL